MVRSRKPLIALVAALAATVLAACGSDDNESSSSSSPTTTAAGSGTTATTAVGTSTTSTGITPTTPTTAATGVTTAGATTTIAAAGGATTTTAVKGRTVTSPDDNVKLGDKGEGVKQIQTALKAAGYNVSVDGDFGNQTDAAVKAFQKKNNLTVDGIVGKVTWGKLSGSGTSATTTTAG